MRTKCVQLALVLGMLLPATPALRADLTAARAEQNLEKRSNLALDNADRALKAARDAYGKGELEETAARVAEVQESVELADKSLQDTGKDPRRSSKWFKRAEIGTRDLLRKMDAFEREMNYADRSTLAPAKTRVQQIHDNLLVGIMEGKKKR